MKKTLLQGAKLLFFIGLGVFLFWKVYKDQPLDELLEAAQRIEYGWLFLAAAISLLSHIVRAIRWKIVFQSINRPVDTPLLYHSVMIGYLANYALPRMGEVSRAAVLKKYKDIPFTVGFGTIITERIVDVIIMLLITLLGVFLQGDFFVRFINDNPAISDRVEEILSLSNILIMAFFTISGIVTLLLLTRNSKTYKGIVEKVVTKIRTFKEGLFSLFTLNQPFYYIGYSILIWVLYFLGMVATLPAFYPLGMDSVNIIQLFVVFIMGSYAMLAPIQGGIGAYHFMVIASLVIFGVDDATARLFALVIHGISTLVVLLGGLVSIALLGYFKRPVNPE